MERKRAACPPGPSPLYTRIKEKADFPYYTEKPAGRYLYLCCRGIWAVPESLRSITLKFAKFRSKG